MMQELVQNDVPPTQIIQLSGHKNLNSVNNYSQASQQQQQNMLIIWPNLRKTPKGEGVGGVVRKRTLLVNLGNHSRT